MKFKRLSESVNNNDTLLSEYRKYANLDEDFEITEDNLDDWALNSAAIKCNIPKADAKHRILGEDITLDQAARETEADDIAEGDKNQVEIVLDRAFKRAKKLQKRGITSDFPNVLIISDAGMGKSEMVRQWAQQNGIHLVEKNLGTMTPEALGGIVARSSKNPAVATRLGTTEMADTLDKPNSVLFLDEYNRAKTEIRGAVLTLVQNHLVYDPESDSGYKFLPNFLFTVAAINPANTHYKGAKELDPAEKSRFYTLWMSPNAMEHLRYLKKFYSSQIEQDDEEEKIEDMGRLKIAETVLSYPDFSYDTAQDIEDNSDDSQYEPLNYRSFKLALDMSDGTKDDFLKVWNHYCNYNKKPIIERALKNYQDVDDKANAALKGGTESDVFKKRDAEWVKQQLRGQGININ